MSYVVIGNPPIKWGADETSALRLVAQWLEQGTHWPSASAPDIERFRENGENSLKAKVKLLAA